MFSELCRRTDKRSIQRICERRKPITFTTGPRTNIICGTVNGQPQGKTLSSTCIDEWSDHARQPGAVGKTLQSMKLSDAQKLIVQPGGHQINHRWFVKRLSEQEAAARQKEALETLRSLLSEDFCDDIISWHRALKQRGLYGKDYWAERFDRIVEDLAASQ